MFRSYQHVVGKTAFALLAFSMLLMCAAAPGDISAQSAPPSTGLVRSATMTIEGKTTDAVISGERHFVVTEATTIIDAYGTRIILDDLSLPAEVEVRYELVMDQDPRALRIVLK